MRIIAVVDVNLQFFSPLFIHERYPFFKNRQINREVVDPEVLKKWRDRTKLLSDEHFSNMLKTLDYELIRYIKSISPVDHSMKEQYHQVMLQSEWYQLYEKSLDLIRERDIPYNKQMGFSYIARPFLIYFLITFDHIIKECQEVVQMDSKVGLQLQQHLAIELTKIAQKTFVLELNLARLKDELEGESSTERFHSFIQQYKDIHKLTTFYDEYMTLARSLATTTQYFLLNIKDLMHRMVVHKDTIYEVFAIDHQDVIEQIAPGEGDTHEQGKTVVKLQFKSGKCLYYKPRNLEISQAFQQFLHWINEKQEVLHMCYRALICIWKI